MAFAILALALATAGTIPTPGSSYQITLSQPSVVNGVDRRPVEYRLTMGVEKVIITGGKKPVEAPVRLQPVDQKIDVTSIYYSTVAGKSIVTEIRLGGTKTRLVFEQ